MNKNTKKSTKKTTKVSKSNKKTKTKATKKTTKKVAKKSTKKTVKTNKSTKKTTKKVTKKANTKSTNKSKAVKKKTVKDKWENITITESGEIIDKSEETGLTDGNGDWNGSTRSDQDIAKEQNPEKRKLLEEIDSLQEEVRRARENDEDDYYVSGLIQDIRMKEARIKEIDFKEQWGEK